MARTQQELEVFLDESLAWRRAEMAALGVEIRRAEAESANSPLARALNRSGVALLYAHWEGFVKEACEAYLQMVANRRLRYSELSDSFVVTSAIGILKRLESGDATAREALLDIVRKPDDARARVPRKGTINTRSNLRFEVLVVLCERLGLPDSSFRTRQQLIDRSLCDQRNEIAHGRLYFPDASSYSGLKDRVLEMLETMRDEIVIHASQKLYRHDASGTS